MSQLLRGVPASRGFSYGGLERIGEGLRQRLSPTTSLTEPLDALSLFENLDDHSVEVGGRSISVDYEVCEATGLTPEAYARYSIERDEILITLSESTYDSLSSGNPRAAFTVMHEIGHGELHADLLIARARMPRDVLARAARSSSHPIYRDTEWQADTLAGAMLAPAKGICLLHQETKDDDMVEAIRNAFGVSLSAAKVRWNIYQERWRQLLR